MNAGMGGLARSLQPLAGWKAGCGRRCPLFIAQSRGEVEQGARFSYEVRNGASAVKIVVSADGSQFISSDDSFLSTTVSSGGFANELRDGVFSGGIVAGTQRVSSGGIAQNVAVTKNGSQIVIVRGKEFNCSAGTKGRPAPQRRLRAVHGGLLRRFRFL